MKGYDDHVKMKSRKHPWRKRIEPVKAEPKGTTQTQTHTQRGGSRMGRPRETSCSIGSIAVLSSTSKYTRRGRRFYPSTLAPSQPHHLRQPSSAQLDPSHVPTPTPLGLSSDRRPFDRRIRHDHGTSRIETGQEAERGYREGRETSPGKGRQSGSVSVGEREVLRLSAWVGKVRQKEHAWKMHRLHPREDLALKQRRYEQSD